MSEFIGYLVATVIQTRCEAKGGELYKSVDAGHSLCKLPK
jgi:hypothetical protein